MLRCIRTSSLYLHAMLGAELTAKKKEVVWDAEIEGDEGPGDDPDIVHNLHIQRVSAVNALLSKAT